MRPCAGNWTGSAFPGDAYDGIATSGDSARAAMLRGAVGEKVYFIGQPHDQDFFATLELIEKPRQDFASALGAGRGDGLLRAF